MPTHRQAVPVGRHFMNSQEFHTSFARLRTSYLEVKSFLEREAGDQITSLDVDIEEQLHIAGDDTYELIEKFVTTYGLDPEGIDLSEYFLSEGEQVNGFSPILLLLSIPLRIMLFFIKIASFSKWDYTVVQLIPGQGPKTKGMTFADLVIWHLTGKFGTRKAVRVLLRCGA